MKNRLFNSFLLLAMVSMMFTACKKDYLEPPIDELPIGKVYTIDSILKMRSGTVFNDDASVYGIVTADEQSGNLYKAAFIQDRATGAALELYMNATSGLRIGDSIRVYLKDVTYSLYNGLPQLKDFEPDGHIVILANNKPIQPAEVTLADVISGKHLGALVKVKNVKFSAIELTPFAESNTYGNRTLVDVDNTDNYATVRTSNYANFAKNTLPQGTGSMVCIASLYTTSNEDVWQLLIRSISELQFDGYYTVLPYFQEFGTEFGSYTPISVSGDQVWEIDHRTAKITGYENNVNYVNEDWLVSSPVAISGIEHAKVRVNYVAQYTNSNTEDVTLQVSTNYVAGTNPSEAEWTQMNVTFPNTSGWSDFQTIETSLDEFIGQTVTVAVKFLSSASQSRTMEVKFVSVEEGQASGGGGGGHGGEVQSLPYIQSFANDFGTYMTYSVAGDQTWSIDYSTAKITGYENSVYYANEDWLISSPVAITEVTDAKMTMAYIGRYFNNINDEVTIWASNDYTWGNDPTTASWTQVSATLSESNSWSNFLTTDISLTEYVGQTVTFAVKYTSTNSKAGTMEIQSITIEEGSGVTPPGPQPGGELQAMPYTQSFASEFGTYMTYDVMGAQSWEIDYQTAKMTGYVGGSYYANEDWLISSPVAITGVDDAKMIVVYIGRYFNNINEEVTFWASTNYEWGSDPTTASWTQVAATLREASNWNDFLTAEISLTEYVGQTVTFAVKYVSTDSKAGTMEIQSITVQEGSGEVPPTPPTPGQGEGSGTADDPYNVAAGIGLQSEEPIAWVHGYIVGAVKSGLSSVSGNGDINWSGPFDLATNVVIADDASCNEISLCIIVNLPAGKPLRTQVNLMDNPDNLGKHLAVNGKLRRYFGQAGLRDSGGTENDFVLEGGVTPPPTPPEPGTGIFSESFANGQGEFTIQDVELAGLSYVWNYMTNYHCMKANGYYQGAHATESWLVSPQIDLSGVNTATLKFDHAVAFADAQGYFFVMVSTNYTGDVTTATWTELNIGTWPEPNAAWVFEGATADLSAFVGQNVTIAFKYTSTEDHCPAWEVKNIVVEE